MTKKLEELLNLPEIQKAMKEADVEEEYVTDDNEEEKGQLEIPDLDISQKSLLPMLKSLLFSYRQEHKKQYKKSL